MSKHEHRPGEKSSTLKNSVYANDGRGIAESVPREFTLTLYLQPHRLGSRRRVETREDLAAGNPLPMHVPATSDKRCSVASVPPAA